MDLALLGKAVLVTGGNRGIGRQIALSFAEEGANVAICARSQEHLGKTVTEVRSFGVEGLALVADLFQAADCQRVVDETAKTFGRFDVLINNASTKVSGTLQTAIAPLVLFLASPRASAITGQTIAVDGGATRGIVY